MKKFKLSFLLCFLILSLALTLTSCFGDSSSDSSYDEPTDKPNAEVCKHEWEESGITFPTCTEDGSQLYQCYKCLETKSEVLPAEGHVTEIIPAVQSTCTEDGVTEGAYCSVCAQTIVEQTFIEAPGHKIVTLEAVAPTCTENGLSEGSYCEVCEEIISYQNTVWAPGHDYVYVDEIYPTCTEDGMTYGESCATCGEVFATPEVIPAYGHNLIKIEGVAATCTKNGLTDGYYCQRCNTTVTEQTVITSLGHKMVFEDNIDPTCEEGGVLGGVYCEVCETVFTKSSKLLPVDHKIENGECIYCHVTISTGLKFITINSGEAYALAGRGSCTDKDVVVPSSVEGVPVTKILSGAFANDSTLESITVIGGITEIEAGAFDSCLALTLISLSKSVTNVKKGAIVGCDALVKLNLTDFDQSVTWEKGYCDSPDYSLTADYKGGKTPYQIYLDAMSVLNDNCDRFRMHQITKNNVYVDGKPFGNASSTSEFYYEAAGIYSTYQHHVTDGIKIWYYDGAIYQIANGQAVKMTASPEYMREMVNSMMADMPTVEEKYFSDAEFAKNPDGSYVLTLIMSPEHLTEMIEVLFEQLGLGSMNGAYISECTYRYVYTSSGNISEIKTNATIVAPDGATTSHGNKLDVINYTETYMTFSDVGTLTSITAPSGNFTDVSKKCNTHYQPQTVPGYAATCEKDGLTDGIYCKYCLQTIQQSEVIEALGHTAENGVCTVCGKLDGASEGLKYEFKADGKTCAVVGIGSCTDTHVIIPESFSGIRVTSIAEGAFAGNTNITAITVPASVTTIGKGAFDGCTSLKAATVNISLVKLLPSWIESVILSSGEKILASDFKHLVNLKVLTLNKELLEIEDGAFDCCKKLVAVTNKSIVSFNADVEFTASHHEPHEYTLIGDFLFRHDDRFAELTKYIGDSSTVVLPESFNGKKYNIDSFAFENRSDVTTLIANASIYLDSHIFGGLDGLTTFIGTGEIAGLLSENDNLVSVTITSGIVPYDCFFNCEKLEMVELLDGVTAIYSGAFANCRALRSVVIANSVTSIGQEAFAYCYSLEELVIPDSVTTIGNSAFSSSGIRFLTIGNGISSLPYGFISSCNIITLTLGSGITEVVDNAFNGASIFEIINNSSYDFSEGLDNVLIHDGESLVTYIEGYAFYLSDKENILLAYVGDSDRLELPVLDGGKTYTVASNAFTPVDYAENTRYTYICIPSCVTKIGDHAFYFMTEVTEIYLYATLEPAYQPFAYSGKYISETETAICKLVVGKDVEEIPAALFTGARIYSLEFEENAKCSYVGGSAFKGTPLQILEIPENLEDADAFAFECFSLREVIYNGQKPLSGYQIFRYNPSLHNNPNVKLIIGKNATRSPDIAHYLRINELVFEEGCKLTYISNFGNQDLLLSIVLPEGITEIYEEAFSGCTALKSVTLPESIEKIGNKAFYGCSALEEVIMPDKHFEIGADAFDGTKIVTDQSGVNAKYVGDVLVEVSSSLRGEFTVREGTKIIANDAFKGLTGLTAVNLPEGLTYISSNAFSGCTALQTVNIPSTVTVIADYAFNRCQKLVLTELPKSLTYIGKSAFAGCTYLEELTLPDSLVYIGSSAFSGCSYLKTVSVPNSLLYLGASAFENCPIGSYVDDIRYIGNAENPYLILLCANASVARAEYNIESGVRFIHSNAFTGYKVQSAIKKITIPEGVVSIGDYAFSNCNYLTTVNLPSTLTEIGEYAFQNCESIKNITIPASVSTINRGAFTYCTALTEITLPASLTTLGASAFSHCTSLKSATFRASSIDAIEEYTFSECTSLENVTLPESVKTMGQRVFENCSSLKAITLPKDLDEIRVELFVNCHSLETVIIQSASRIGSHAFYGCTALVSITLPDSITVIEEHAFNGCASLKSIVIPSKVTQIYYAAFINCTGLESITLSESLMSIGNSAFENCTALKEIYIPASVESMGDNVFKNCTSIRKLEVAPENIDFVSYENCIYNYQTEILFVALSTATLPTDHNVKAINAYIIETDESWTLTVSDYVNTVYITNQSLDYLEEIHFGAKVRRIDIPFSACKNLKNITVSEDNQYFYVSDGCLYNKSNNSVVFDFSAN